MTGEELAALRLRWGLTQSEMARRMGYNRRSYISLETGERPIQDRHRLAIERISIDIAVERGDPSLIKASLRYVLDHYMELEASRQDVEKRGH